MLVLPAASVKVSPAMSNVALVCEFAVGVNSTLYTVLLVAAKLLKVPPVAAISSTVKSVLASLKVILIVDVSPDFKLLSTALNEVTVGLVASRLAVSVTAVAALPAASNNDTESVSVPSFKPLMSDRFTVCEALVTLPLPVTDVPPLLLVSVYVYDAPTSALLKLKFTALVSLLL